MRQYNLPKNPFVGLRPFESQESILFFGRDDHVDELTQRLYKHRFLAVVGSSGSGKSSLVRAGLIPRLRAGLMVSDRDQWKIAIMKPGGKPLENLTLALLKVLSQNQDRTSVENFLSNLQSFGVKAIDEYFGEILDECNGNLLLLVDQFEELFRFGLHTENEFAKEEAKAFASIMLDLANKSRLPIYIVITMRSDFLGDCDAFYGLPEALNRSQFLVPRLNRKQRREAIEGPIRLYGQNISPRLVDRLLNDASDESDQLPVMQHALMRTWHYWDKARENGTPIEYIHYKNIGEINHALSQHANEALQDMSEKQLNLTEKIFRALTTTDESNRRIRREAYLNELVEITETDTESIWEVIQKFRSGGRSFLVVSPEDPKENPLIDISHESLIRRWDLLRTWVDVEAESARFYKRLAEDAEAYSEGKADLWRNPKLESGLDWLEKEKPNKVWAKRYHEGFDNAIEFLDKSKTRAKNLKRAMTLLLVVLLSALIFVNQRLQEGEQAMLESEIAQKQLIIEAAERKRAELEAESARKAKRLSDSTAEVLRLAHNRVDSLLRLEKKAAADAKESEERAILEANLAEKRRREAIAARDSAKRSQERVEAVALAIRAARQLQVGKIELAALLARQAYYFDEKSGRHFHNEVYNALRNSLNALSENAGGPKILAHNGWVHAVAFAPTGRFIVSGSEDNTIKVWDLQKKDEQSMFTGHTGSIRALAFSLDGHRLISASDDKSVRIWDIDNRKIIATLREHNAPVKALAISRDGRWLASGSAGGTILVRRFSDSGIEGVFSVDALPAVKTLAFGSPESNLIASGHADGTLQLWRIPKPKNPVLELLVGKEAHQSEVNAIAFDNAGKKLASGGQDFRLVLWDVRPIKFQKIREFTHEGPVNSVSFSPVEDVLVSGSSDNNIRIWDLRVPKAGPIILRDNKSWVLSVAFNQKGTRLLSGNRDTNVRIWNISAQELADRVCKLVKRTLTKEEWDEYVSKELKYQPACADIDVSDATSK